MWRQSRLRPDHSNLLSRYSADLGQCVSRQRTERALRAAAVDQAVANRAKSEFLANMSHELRTPLNAIIGFSDLIGQTPLDDANFSKPVEYAALINRAGKHLLNIISDILDLSKIESGTFVLDLEKQSMRELLSASIELLRPRVTEKKQTIQLLLPPSLPDILGDGRRLKQVIINILSNAHKFSAEGGRIVVTTAVEKNKTIIVAVRDSGIGMSEDQIATALKPFGQIKSSHTRGHEGTGLGLPISKSIVEQHGGRFLIESTAGAGTTVAFTIPILPPDEMPAPPFEETPS